MRDVTRHTAAASEAAQRHIAGDLRRRGLREGDRVALLVPGSAGLLDTVLAATRSGIVPVPLDPGLTARERDALLGDAGPALVIDDPAMIDELAAGPEHDLAAWPRCRPMHFTSGTTGLPKGVWSGLLGDAEARAAVQEERDLWGFGPDDVNVAVSPLHHSAPLRFAIGTLLAGGSVIVLPRFDAAQFADVVAREQPTTMFCVPAHLQRWFAWEDATGRRIGFGSFRLVAHAGAPCPEPVRRRAHAEIGLDTVWEFYGSTEGQFTACAAPDWHRHPGTLGRARPGRTIRADADGQLWCTVPAWGRFSYWRDEEKTTAAWRDGPDGPEFTVGDLGRVDDDGWVHLDARRTDLIISGGVNVYPAEVEKVLEAVPGVDEVAVFGRPDDHWGQRVCAAWVGEADEASLRAAAQAHLAPAKRPKAYLALDALPRTATGKIRRTELTR